MFYFNILVFSLVLLWKCFRILEQQTRYYLLNQGTSLYTLIQLVKCSLLLGFKSVRIFDLNKKNQLGLRLKVCPECVLFILLFLINFSSPDCFHQYNIWKLSFYNYIINLNLNWPIIVVWFHKWCFYWTFLWKFILRYDCIRNRLRLVIVKQSDSRR